MSSEYAVLTPDAFLRTLELRELEPLVTTANQRDALFRVAIEYIKTEGKFIEDDSVGWHGEMSMRVPGSALVVRLGKPSEKELAAILAIVAALMGTNHLDAKSVTLTAALAIMNRVSKVKAEYGERSIIEVVSKLPRPTAKEVTLELFGNKCRNPKASCRYMDSNNMCQISLGQVESTITSLEEREIVRKLNATPPIEYGIVV